MLGFLGTRIKQAAAGEFVKALDIRVPTTTPHLSAAQRDEILHSIQPGDICLETNDAYPGWQRFERITMRTNHTHAFIYEGNGKLLQSTTPNGVQRTDLADYLKGRIHVMVIRPPYQSQQDVAAAIDYAAAQLGKPYNEAFNGNDTSKFYCSQLVSEALRHMPHPIETPQGQFRGHGFVAPDAFNQIPGARIIVDDHATFWKSQRSHWPVFTSTVACTAGGAVFGAMHGGVIGGVLGGVVGLVVGLPMSVATGNLIQTGHFGLGANVTEEA
jgi:cell wall-associated NlpC family hydrolase